MILFATNPDYFFGSGTFARDINKKFKLLVNLIQKEKKNMGVTEEDKRVSRRKDSRANNKIDSRIFKCSRNFSSSLGDRYGY
jgi:hypothetical protein